MADVRLRSHIKKLVVTYPEWRVAVIDEQLIQFHIC
jgi:hypothetical protein